MKLDIRYRHHSRVVSLWAEHALAGLDEAEVLELSDRMLGHIINQVAVSLGTTTLTAVLDRVIYFSGNHHPILKGLTPGIGKVKFSSLTGLDGTTPTELREAVHLFLTELLSTLGALTAESISPSLHAILQTKKDKQ